jgi:hypothetical protein
MAEPVTIPISVFELKIDYQHPELRLWSDRGAVVQAIFDALGPWSPNVDDMEPRTTGKVSENGVIFRLPLKRVSFFFGPASCNFTQDGTDWNSADETTAIVSAALSALVDAGGVRLGPRNAAIALHIQPRTLRFVDMLSPFLVPQMAALENQPITTMAVIAKWGDKRKVTLDGSGVIANAVYLRFERQFDSESSFEEMARQLRADEEELFRLLGIEEEIS